MTQTPSNDALAKLLRGIDIPPCPEILLTLQREIARPDAALTRVAEVVSRDVGLSAAVLKVANSPAFGVGRKVGTIQQAITVLGSRSLAGLVSGELLQKALAGDGDRRLDRFWDSSRRTALVCSALARALRLLPAEVAYSLGLFLDCGIPVLMKRFPDYIETLKLANGAAEPFTAVEDARHATNHAVVGYFLTRNWGLPELVSQAILLHHDAGIFAPDADEDARRARTPVALAMLACEIVCGYLRMGNDAAWRLGGAAAGQHLGLGETEVFDLTEEMHALLDQSEAG